MHAATEVGATPAHARGRRTAHRSRWLRRSLVALALAMVGVLPTPAAAAPGDLGVEGPVYVEATNPTYSRAQSKLWFHDGHWYAALLRTGTPSATGRPNADFYAYRLEGGTWVPTATLLEDRGTTKLDVVARGDVLYVVSHKYVGHATGVHQTDAGNMTRISRFTWDAGSGRYTRDAGYPRVVNDLQMESLTIDVDATGAIWAAFVQSERVHWQRSTDGGRTWSAPTPMAGDRAATSADDIAGVVAFEGGVGILWADQVGANDGFWFATAAAGAGAVTWSQPEAAYTGPGIGDDHLDLEALGGDVYAAVKTRADTGTNPLVSVLHRTPSGAWSHHTAYVGRSNTTRPSLAIDATHATANVFVTGPEAAGGNGEAGGVVYRKTAPLATLTFGDGLGEPVMGRPGSHVNDVTGTKQPVTNQTGLAVVAADGTTTRYWHHAESLVLTAPSAPSGVTAVAGNGRVSVRWTAATAGDAPIDHYRITATPALGAPVPDQPASATGTAIDVTVPNDVTRVFHVQAVAAGAVGPAADSDPVTPGAYVPFLTPESFAQQQARDFLGRDATTDEQAQVRSAFVGGGASAADVVLGSLFYGNASVAGTGAGPEARVARLYFAYFKRSPDRSGYDHWVGVLRSGRSLERISAQFAASSEFVRTYGSLTDDKFVELVYRNLFDRAPDQGGRTYWLGKLRAGLARGTMMTRFSESSEYVRRSQLRVATVILFRHMLQRTPTASELTVVTGLGSPAAIVDHVIGSKAYQDRIER